jgi:alkylation response protein AidB-like acyl-CoA dehydrogenase
MTIIEQTPTATLDAVQAMAPSLAARSAEIEAARALPTDVVGQLVAAGCFRTLAPRRFGGLEAELGTQLDVLETLARADGSVGWTVTHARWFVGHCVVDDGRMPPLRMMVMPIDDVEIVDTWSVSGLCGTGSHDVRAVDVFVPDEMTFSIFEETELDEPIVRIHELSLSTLEMASVAIGIAAGALDDVIALAAGKTPMFADTTLAGNPLFRFQLAEADAHLRAARALVHADAAEAWAMAIDGAPFDDVVRARFRSSAIWATSAATTVVDTAYRAGGGTSLYRASPLQRRLRDVHALTQHFGVKLDTYTLAGAVLAGAEVDTSFL